VGELGTVAVGVAVVAPPVLTTTTIAGVLVGAAVPIGVEGGADVTVACGVRVGVVVGVVAGLVFLGVAVGRVPASRVGVVVAVGTGVLVGTLVAVGTWVGVGVGPGTITVVRSPTTPPVLWGGLQFRIALGLPVSKSTLQLFHTSSPTKLDVKPE
jgi:hypothetical protein